jgi:hypothetical protein
MNEQKTLTEIMQELVYYCALHGSANNVALKVKIPPQVLESYSKQFHSREITRTDANDMVLKTLHLDGGTVEFES